MSRCVNCDRFTESYDDKYCGNCDVPKSTSKKVAAGWCKCADIPCICERPKVKSRKG